MTEDIGKIKVQYAYQSVKITFVFGDQEAVTETSPEGARELIRILTIAADKAEVLQ